MTNPEQPLEVGIGAATELPPESIKPTLLQRAGAVAIRIVFGPHYYDK